MFHFIIGAVDDDLVIEYFVDGDPTARVVHADETTLEALAVLAGIFPSKGQARKNGLAGDVPAGITLQGTKKKKFWVWRN
jgi:hypothetical protein